MLILESTRSDGEGRPGAQKEELGPSRGWGVGGWGWQGAGLQAEPLRAGRLSWVEPSCGGRVQRESAPVTQGLENARETMSQLC